MQRHETEPGERVEVRQRWPLGDRRPPVKRGLPALAVAAVLAAQAAFAADVDASLTGLMQVRPTLQSAEEVSFMPFIAQLGLRVSEKKIWGFDDIRAEVGAWGRLSAMGGTNAGDVDLAYVSARAFDKRLTVTLGRQFRSGGALRGLHLDGLAAEALLPGRVGLMAFGGVPVISRFALQQGDATFGGRLFWRPSWETEIGASYFELWNVGYVARRDLGLDFRTLLARRLMLSGLGVFSALEARLAEADLNARWQVTDTVELYGGFRHTAPDLFLPRTSIFSTFADIERNEGSLGVYWSPDSRWSAGVDGKVLSIMEGLGYEASGQVGFRPSRDTRTTLQLVRLGLPSNAYSRARLAGRHTFNEKLTLVLDLDAALFDAPINGRTLSLQGQLTARLPLPANFELLVSGLAATDPLYKQRFEVLARVVYTFRYHSSEGAK